MKKINCLVFLFLATSTLSTAFSQYVPPRKSSEGAKYDYQNSHYPATNYNNASYAPKNNGYSAERTTSTSSPASSSATSRPIVRKTYSYIGNYVNGLANATDSSGSKWGCIDQSQKVIVPLKYAEPLEFVDGISIASKDISAGYGVQGTYEVATKILRYGFVNNIGNEIAPPIYRKASRFSEGLAVLSKEGFIEIVDKTGKLTATNIIYNQSRVFKEGLCAVQSKDSFWGFINTKGDLIIPMIYEKEDDFKNGKTQVSFNGKTLFLDKTGREINENGLNTEKNSGAIVYEDRISSPFFSSITAVKLKGKWGLLDANNKLISAVKYDNILFPKNDGMAMVTVKDKQGYINLLGEEVIPPIYDKLEEFNTNSILAHLDGKVGLFESNGKLIIPFTYDDISLNLCDMNSQTFKIRLNNKFGWVDNKGTEILAPIYETAECFRNGLFTVQKGDKWGMLDKSGAVKTPFIYDWIFPYTEGDLYTTKVNGKTGFLNSAGEEIIPPIYDDYVFYQGEKKLIHLVLKGKHVYFNFKGRRTSY